MSAIPENVNASSSISLAVRTIFITSSSSMVVSTNADIIGASFNPTTVILTVPVSKRVPSLTLKVRLSDPLKFSMGL